MQTFQTNLDLWSRKAPLQAARLPFQTASEDPKRETLEEAQRWFKSVNLEQVEVLCVYGIGLGYVFEVLRPWLEDENHFLVFFEDQPGQISAFFQLALATDMLQHPQVWLYALNPFEDNKEVLDQFSWNFVNMALGFASPAYETEKKDAFVELKEKVLFVCATKNAYLDEYFNYGIVFYRNFYPNLLQLPEAYLGTRLFGKFAGVPAIICGAGPSLQYALPFLRQNHPRAMIFAGGSALTALSQAKIQPHFGVGIDPNPEQFERLNRIEKLDYPFFFRSRLDWRSLQLAHGPHLYIPGSGGYDTSQWFEDELNLDSCAIDEGHNVVNFATDIATAMGCYPIIYVGMDLAFTENKLYTPGVLDINEVPAQTEEVFKNLEEAIVEWKDIHGKAIKTCWKWISESEWISSYAKEHPEQLLLNATGHGIGFSGVANMTMDEIAKKFLAKVLDIPKMIEKELSFCRIENLTRTTVISLMEKLSESLERAVSHLDLLIEEAEKAKQKMLSDDKLPSHPSALAVLAETDLDEEVAYRYVLAIFNEACSRSFYRQFHQSKIAMEEDPVKGTLLKSDLNLKRFVFLKTVALVNREIIQDTIKSGNIHA